MKAAKLVEEFLEYVKAELAEATYDVYAGRLRAFVAQFGDREFKKIKRKEFEKYFKDGETLKNGRPAAPDTVRLHVVAVEQLHRYALKKKVIKKPIFPRPPRPGGRRRERIPTREEQAKILHHAWRRQPPLARVLRALWQCGARPSEIAKARIEDLDRGTNLVIVLAAHKTARKTGQARRIGVGKNMRRTVFREIGTRESGPIFRMKGDEAWSAGAISRGFSAIRDKLGFSRDLVLYSLRHSFGTRICRKFGIHAAAKALGHTNVNMSQRYVHLGDDALIEYQDGVS